MSKILELKNENFFNKMFPCRPRYGTFDNGTQNGNNFLDGYSYGYGICDGEGEYNGNSYSCCIVDYHMTSNVTTIADAVDLEPLEFISNNKIVTWDDAWGIATEEEKLILILWMPLR
jgi:hypothetical protein